MQIPAVAKSDDGVYEVEFDAVYYFQNTSDVNLLSLIKCNFAYDYPADDVVYYCAHCGPKPNVWLVKLLEYLEAIADIPSKKDVRGFECVIHTPDAVAWLQQHKPHLLKGAEYDCESSDS